MKRLEKEVEETKSQIKNLKDDLKKQDFVMNCIGKTYRVESKFTFCGMIYEIEGIELFQLQDKDNFYCFSTSTTRYVIETEKVEIESRYKFIRVLWIERSSVE